MWAKYRQEQSNDGIVMSPYLRSSSAMLTPPATYHLDARRNSTASTLSSLGPDTPIYGRSPFSNDSHVNPTDHNMAQSQSMAVSTSDCPKGALLNDSFSDHWSVMHLNMEHGVPMSMNESFASDASILQPVGPSYNGLPATAPDGSCWYQGFHSQLSDETGHVDYTGTPHWGLQAHQPQMPVARTMVPSEVMLHDGYVFVDSKIDADYDDSDVPLPPSPQDVLFRQEADLSERQRGVKRSIFISSTGGKMVKREHGTSGVSKARKTRKSRCKLDLTPPPKAAQDANDTILEDGELRDTEFEDLRILVVEDNLHDIERDPRTNKLRRRGAPQVPPQICKIPKSDGTPCGKKFQRQEHLSRHQKSTHTDRDIYQCQMCYTWFNQVDYGWEHSWTHTRLPGRNKGRNFRTSLRHVLKYSNEPKHKDKLLNKWRNATGGLDYCPEAEQEDEEDEERRLAIWRVKDKKRREEKEKIKRVAACQQ